MNLTIKRKRFGVDFFIITMMDIPADNRQFYKILNDDDLLSQLIRDQNLAVIIHVTVLLQWLMAQEKRN